MTLLVSFPCFIMKMSLTSLKINLKQYLLFPRRICLSKITIETYNVFICFFSTTLNNSQAFKELSFDERLALMVDEEVNDKYNNLVTCIQRKSKIKMMNATLEDIQYYPDQELDKDSS